MRNVKSLAIKNGYMHYGEVHYVDIFDGYLLTIFSNIVFQTIYKNILLQKRIKEYV